MNRYNASISVQTLIVHRHLNSHAFCVSLTQSALLSHSSAKLSDFHAKMSENCYHDFSMLQALIQPF